MGRFIKYSVILLALILLPGTGYGQTEVSLAEARTVAEAWIAMEIAQQGNWAGSRDARVAEIQELKKDDLLVGYLCKIEPDGVIVVSRYRELAPVKFYTDQGQFDGADNQGMALFLKDYMARQIIGLERLAAEAKAASTKIDTVQEVDFAPLWNHLLGKAPGADDESEIANYQTGQILLSSAWHQSAPYNDDCPFMSCPDTGNGRALVGCVATAGAQIMRYWNWPPYGKNTPYNDRYDWPNMRDRVTTASPQVQIDAVAELNREVGRAVGMSYGCSGSGAPTSNMEGVYQNFYRYATACRKIDRDAYSHDSWYNIMKTEFDYNRPLQYRIPGHSIVGDGWKERYVHPYTYKEIHINYGWGGTHTGWFTLYSIPGGDPGTEYMLENIYPAQVLSEWISGTYGKNAGFPYRYVAWDTFSNGVIFEQGQNIQFLPGVTLTCTSSTGQMVFNGTSSENTLLFSRGNESAGARIRNGAIKMTNHGSIKFH